MDEDITNDWRTIIYQILINTKTDCIYPYVANITQVKQQPFLLSFAMYLNQYPCIYVVRSMKYWPR